MKRRSSRARRSQLVGVAIATSLLAAACAGDDTGDATDASSGSVADSAASVTTVASSGVGSSAPDATQVSAPEFEPTTLTLWSSFTDQPSIDAFEVITARCEADLPWLTIDYVGKEDLSTALAAAVEAGSPPDLLQADVSGELAAVEAGELIVAIDDLAARDGVSWDSFVPGGERLVEFNGKRYGLPLSLDTVGLFYNQDALSDAGIGQPPSTAEELIDAAERLLIVGDDGAIERVGFVPDVGDGSYALFLTQYFGATLFSADGTEVTISDTLDEWMAGLQWQQRFYDLMDPDAFARWADGLGSYDSADNFFIAGQLPLYFEGSYFITWPDRFGGGIPENWGVVPMPGPDGVADPDQQSFIASGNSFMIPQGAADTEASWAALKCMALAGDEIADFEATVGNIPANIEALDTFEAEQVALYPAYQSFIDLARSPAAQLPPSAVVRGALSDEMTALILDYRRGDVDDDGLRAELEELDSRYQDELDLELGN